MDPPLTAQAPAGAELTWRGPLAQTQPNLQGILGPEQQPVVWAGHRGPAHQKEEPLVSALLLACCVAAVSWSRASNHPLVCEQRPTTSQERGLEQKGRNRQGRPFLPGSQAERTCNYRGTPGEFLGLSAPPTPPVKCTTG